MDGRSQVGSGGHVCRGDPVATAKERPEAIQGVEDAPFDLVLMDIKLPLMDGM